MMIKLIRLITCCLFALSATSKANAQDSNENTATHLRHEIAIYGGGGMSAINYSLTKNGSKTDDSGGSGTAGIGYTYNINESIGILTGIEVTRYGAKAAYDDISGEYIYGTDKYRFNFIYSISNYIEEQDVMMLSAPVMAQYSTPLSNSIKFYLAGGFKIGLPVNAKATIFPNVVNTSGDAYHENQTYTGLPKHGFVTGLKPGSITKDIDLTVSLAASIETGARFSLYGKLHFYAGLYLDYGLTNIRSIKDKQILNYSEDNPFLIYESILNTSYVNGSIKTFGAGLKVKISFGW